MHEQVTLRVDLYSRPPMKGLYCLRAIIGVIDSSQSVGTFLRYDKFDDSRICLMQIGSWHNVIDVNDGGGDMWWRPIIELSG